jgi:hypothetical protein
VDADLGLEWKTDGVWLGCSLPVSLFKKTDLNLDGMIFFPFTRVADVGAEGYWFEVFDPSKDEYRIREGNTELEADLDQTTWFCVDLNVDREYLNNLSFLLGVRYDYLQSALKGPDYFRGEAWETQGDSSGVYSTDHFSEDIPFNARIDVNLNSIFPYVGLRTSAGDASTRLDLTLKAAPLALRIGRDAPYKAYLAQVELNYTTFRLNRRLGLDIFTKYTHAKGFFNRIGNIGGVFNEDLASYTPDDYTQYIALLDFMELEQEMTVTWKQLILGAGLTWNFSLDFP